VQADRSPFCSDVTALEMKHPFGECGFADDGHPGCVYSDSSGHRFLAFALSWLFLKGGSDFLVGLFTSFGISHG
jgi:hypothetical protein